MAYAPLQKVIPSYLYWQYSDDDNLQAFVSAFNTLAQEYLTWFNAHSLAVYSSADMSGPLLDWIMNGLYGLQRPVFASQTNRFVAGLNASPVNVGIVDGARYYQSGTATPATDDYFKRVATWWLYVGNGRYFTVALLRLKVARFLYGINGTDVTLAQAQSVRIQPQRLPSPPAPVLGGSSTSFLDTESGNPVLTETSGTDILLEASGSGGTWYAVWNTYVSPLGETLSSPPSTYQVPSGQLLVGQSPPPTAGAIGWNTYVTVLAPNVTPFVAGVDAQPVNAYALNAGPKRGHSPPQIQNATPIPIGNAWVEPGGGLVVGQERPTKNTSNTPGNFIIAVPHGTASTYFQQAMQQDLLSWPFQFTATVVVASS